MFRKLRQFLTFLAFILFSMVAAYAIGAEEAAPVGPVVPQYEAPAARTAAAQTSGNTSAKLSTTGRFAALELGITDGPQSLPVSGMFNSSGGGPLIYTAASSETAVATLSITESILTITPVATGTADITITARDNASDLAATQTFQVTVTSIIQPDASIPNQQLTPADGPQTLDLSNYVRSPQSGAVSFTASSNDLSTATVGVAGNILTITPVATGTATITITIRNSPFDAGVMLNFQVQVINFPPTSSGIPDQQLLFAGSNKQLDLNDYFSDPEGDPLRYSDARSSNPAVATVLKGVPDNFLFIIPTPNGVSGTTDISVTASDRPGATLTQVFQVETTNQAPTHCCTFIPIAGTVTGGPKTLDLDNFFSDPDASSIPNHALRYNAVSSNTAIATTRINRNVLTITPVKRGNVIVTVTASDGLEDTSLRILVRIRPSALSTTGIPDQGLTFSGHRSTQTLNLNNYFSDPDGDGLTYEWQLRPRGTLRVTNASLSGSMLSISTRGEERGTDRITVTASKRVESSTFTAKTSFLVVVDPAPPRLTSLSIGIRDLLLAHSPQTFNLDDYFESFFPLSYTVTSDDPDTVRVRVDGSRLTVIPVAPSTEDIRIIISGSNGFHSIIDTFEVRVPNKSPRTKGRGQSFNFRTTNHATFIGSNHFEDPDGDTLIYTVRNLDASIATIALNSATGVGSVRALRPGNTAVQVTARDPLGAEVTRSFAVSASASAPRVTAPILDSNQRYLLQRNGIGPANRVRLDLNDYFSDDDGGQPIYTVEKNARPGRDSVRSNLSGSILTIEPTGNPGVTTFTVTATDRILSGLNATQTFQVEVVNNNPTRNNTPFEPNVPLSLGRQTLNLDNYFSDANSDPIRYELAPFVSDYVTIRVDRIGRRDNLIITPLARGGPMSFNITASDLFGGEVTHEFEIKVGNSAPVRVNGIPALVMNQRDGPQKLVNIGSKFFDHDGDALTYTATPSGAGGDSVATVDVDGDVLTITPRTRGMVDFDIFASDGRRTSGGSLILSRPLTLSVNVKVAPTIDGTPALTANEDSLYNFAPTGADADGDPLTYSIVTPPPLGRF